MAEDWEKHGVAVIERVRQEDPVAYLKIVASIVPKEVKIDDRSIMDDMSNDDLLELLAAIREFKNATGARH